MKIFATVPKVVDSNALLVFLSDRFRAIATQVNALSEGSIAARHGALVAAPTVGKHKVGDEAFNSAPVELGAVGSKYVVRGWLCVADGEPGTWVEQRVLTGN